MVVVGNGSGRAAGVVGVRWGGWCGEGGAVAAEGAGRAW